MNDNDDADYVASAEFLSSLRHDLEKQVFNKPGELYAFNGRSYDDVLQDVLAEIVNYLRTGLDRMPDGNVVARTPHGIRDYAERRFFTLINTYARSARRQCAKRNAERDGIIDSLCASRPALVEHPHYDKEFQIELRAAVTGDPLASRILDALIASELLPSIPDFKLRCNKQLARFLNVTENDVRAARNRISRTAKRIKARRIAQDNFIVSRKQGSI